MDGNKKIVHFSLWLILIFGLTACNVQKPSYVSLYVDDIDYTQDSVIVEDKITVDEKKATLTIDTLEPFKLKDIKNTSDSLCRSDIIELLNEITDSLYTLHLKLDSVLNVKSVGINSIIVHEGQSNLDSLSINSDYIQKLKNQSQVITIKETDTVFIEKNVSQTGNDDIEALKKQLVAKNDTIQKLINQSKSQPQSKTNTITKTDTVYIKDTLIIENFSSQKFNNQRNMGDVQKQLVAKNDTIQQLKNQLKSQLQQKNNTITKTDSVYKRDTVIIETPSSQNFNKQRDMEQIQKQLIAKNDTIQQLKIELKNKQQPKTKTITKTDSVFIENTTNKIVDTALIVAFYKMGKIAPEGNIISQIINVLQNNKVHKIEISGFTDSSGNSSINKKITDSRINYIISKISLFIATSNIYYQNFGDTLASKNIVPEERRVEIKIYYNIKD